MVQPHMHTLGTDTLAASQVDDGTQTEIAALYDMTTNTFVPYHITEHPFCSGHTLLPDGRGIIVGTPLLQLSHHDERDITQHTTHLKWTKGKA